MIDYSALIERWQGSDMDAWAKLLPGQISSGLSPQRYGDLPRWLQVLEDLPDISSDGTQLTADRVGTNSNKAPPPMLLEQLRAGLQGLHPWRKGPFELFGVQIDTEWRSD